jgi:serine/threonine-protein kinase
MFISPSGIERMRTLNRLLDDGLRVGPSHCESWFVQLPAEHRHLAVVLRRMLCAHWSKASRDGIDTLPSLALPHEPLDARPGDRCGRFTLKKRLGTGGLSEVWLAAEDDSAAAQTVALKLARHGRDEAGLGHLQREAEILGRLHHPGMVRLLDVCLDSNPPHLVLEHIDGVTLDTWWRDHERDSARRLWTVQQLAMLVGYLHRRGFAHRDLKPGNVLVERSGRVRLIDFGIAAEAAPAGQRGCADGARSFTPAYAAPEQIRGAACSPTADVFALGALAYEALTGRHLRPPRTEKAVSLPPKSRQVELRIDVARIRSDLEKTCCSSELVLVVMDALSWSPGRRPANADTFASRLDDATLATA